MANGLSLIIGLIIIVAACIASYFFAPKGENQTIWRSSLILGMSACYIMWAITFLAQWHPLIEPKRTDLRADRLPN